MTIEIFKPEDFGGSYSNLYTSLYDAIGIAQIANRIFNQWIKNNEKSCEHKNIQSFDTYPAGYSCLDCKKTLKQTWTAVE